MPARWLANIAFPALVIATTAISNAASLLRGPYIQNNTTSSVMLVWKHVPASDATVEFGTTLAYGSSLPAGSDTLHVVTVGDLAPATRYYYRLLAGSEVLAAGENHWFETSAASGGVRVALFGDSGKGTSTQTRMARRIIRQEVDLTLHTGDIVYDTGQEVKYDSRFFQPYADLLRHTPIFTAPGNHDLVSQGGSPYFSNFYLPTDRTFDGTEKHYSFDWGDAHFVSVSTTTLTRPVADWVASDLAASDRRWKFVWFHHAVYSCGYHGIDLNVDSLLVPVFDAQSVDMVFTGHEHDFQRTHPIRNDQVLAQGDNRNYVNPGGTLYVITGGGAEPRATSNLCSFTNVARSIPHVSRMQIAGDCLYFDAVDSTGAVVDSMSIRKTTTPEAPFVQLLRGNGHEVWKYGTQPRITWLAGGVRETLDLEISRDGGATYNALARGIATSGSHPWTVTGPSATDVRLRLVARSQADSSAVMDVSDAPIVVDASGEPVLPPAVTVAANPTTGEGTFAVTFSGTATALGSATLSAVQWDLNDGTTATENVTVHTYGAAGTYVARFTATDDTNRSTTDSVTVNVRSAAAPILATQSPAPDATEVAALSPLIASIVDRGAGVSPSGVALRMDGVSVTPTCTGTSDSLVVRYAASSGFTPGDTVLVELDATDNATPPNTAAWTWSFIVSSAPVVNAKMNFEPSGFATPAGFIADRGAVYSTSSGFGWDRITKTEKRGTTLAPELDSYAYLTNSSPATWQMAVPNGAYEVTVVVGSPAFTGLHRVTIENLLAVNNVATADGQFHTVTDFPVTVADGFMSVRVGGISGNTKKTKLCWLRVRSAGTSSSGSSGGGTTANQSPSVNATATPATGTAPLGVLLAANATDPDGDTLIVTWDFGDGQTGSGTNASHTYMAGSHFAIALATDARGATARDTVAIVATAAAGGSSTAVARVNFQPSTFAIPGGYSADSGKLFDATRTYGWSVSLKSEAATYSDPRLASYVYVTNTTAATWDLAVPNGVYAVTVVAGSPAFTGLHRVEVEGTLAIANVATASGGFITATDIPVVVADGRLSVRIGGIAGSTKKTKLCYLHVDRPSSKVHEAPLRPGLRLFAEPNPSRTVTTVRLATATATQARIDIYDVRGRRLRALFEGALPAGELGIAWDGRLDSGVMVSSGIYYVRASTPLQHLVLKLTLLR